MTASYPTRINTADGFTLTTAESRDSRRLPVTATVTIDRDRMTATIRLSDLTGDAGDPIEVPVHRAEAIARRMLALDAQATEEMS